MVIYHGSTVLVDKPEIRTRNIFLDFGVGFYTTSSYEQAERWARIKMRRENQPIGYVSTYEFDYETASKNSAIKQFHSADIEWLTFVTNCRRGEAASEPIDIHIGPVADDNVYQSIRLFETGVLNADDTIKRLKTEVLHDQWTFHTDKALSFCRFIKSVEVMEVR